MGGRPDGRCIDQCAQGDMDVHTVANHRVEERTADDAVGAATLLCAVTLNSTGTGINFDAAAAGGVLQKAPGEVWSGANVTGGVDAWYRHVAAGDDGTLSTTAPRVQGLVGVAGADLNLSSVSLVAGATQTVDYYSLAWPTL